MNTLRQIYPNINKNLKLQIQIPFVNTLLGKHPWYMSKKNVLLICPTLHLQRWGKNHYDDLNLLNFRCNFINKHARLSDMLSLASTFLICPNPVSLFATQIVSKGNIEIPIKSLNMFNFNNKDTKRASLMSLCFLYYPRFYT